MKKFIILFKKTQQCPLGVIIGINILYIINHIMQKMSFTKTAARSIIVDMSKMYMKMIIRGLVMYINLNLVFTNTILIPYGFLEEREKYY